MSRDQSLVGTRPVSGTQGWKTISMDHSTPMSKSGTETRYLVPVLSTLLLPLWHGVRDTGTPPTVTRLVGGIQDSHSVAYSSHRMSTGEEKVTGSRRTFQIHFQFSVVSTTSLVSYPFLYPTRDRNWIGNGSTRNGGLGDKGVKLFWWDNTR